MARNLQQIILGELALYSQRQQKAISAEFREKYPSSFSKSALLEFLKEKLQIEKFWANESWLNM